MNERCGWSWPGGGAGAPARRPRLRILFLTTAHNGLSQRVGLELLRLGHSVSVALATSDAAMVDAADAGGARPDRGADAHPGHP